MQIAVNGSTCLNRQVLRRRSCKRETQVHRSALQAHQWQRHQHNHRSVSNSGLWLWLKSPGAIVLHDVQTGTSLASFKQSSSAPHCTIKQRF
ncbi:uncharacterized protein BJ212DRAFT_73397 [Suillus subaureus]|uniref:Uncharacterized protein n=1 Tax=Suillus subaureus TaxID=48587 RepID=A0A9P7JFC5_9AGAM|nr:uncharacterized protein BJ212DRAFT_73397 [Suillus subaureus]KAG1819137.1 hypothetical protein BJ212DRAFT_73397 [Suillus subaureus]